MNALLHAHSGLRWIVFILMLATIIDSAIRMYRPFKESERKLALFALISLHTQFLIGIILYIFSPTMRAIFGGHPEDIMGNSIFRFWVVEHPLMMLIAVILVTVGYSRAKRQSEHWAKHRMTFFYYLAALILILLSIPWPFREVGLGRGWF
jgi:FtsH-binding integral membrane protein